MAEIIRMPLLSDTMKEGVIASWHKKVGDQVQSDDIIAEVETDKATMEVMPYVDGTILYLAGDNGVSIPINGVMAIIGEPGEDYKTLLANEATADEEQPAASTSEATPAPQAVNIPDDVTVVRMPLLSDTMKEGKIVSWLKEEGDDVVSDDVLAEVETDKATMEVMGYADGTLLHIGVPAGSAAKINEIICIVGPKGTDVSAVIAAENSAPLETTSTEDAVATPKEERLPTTADTATPATNTHPNRVKISPLAKKMANEKGIDITSLKGTGDGGRIVKRDIINYTPTTSTASPTTQTVLGQESHTDTNLSQMRKVIAQRLAESKFNAPHFYLKTSIKMDAAIEARKAMNAIADVKISFNDFIIKACAMALKKHPEVNSSWMGDFIRTNHHVNIGTAVAVPDGLIVPVVKHADLKTLSQISKDAKTLIGKARDKKLQPEEFTGNTFTISNLGMMDIDEFTAIINPPDSCILAVGKIEATPVVEDGTIVVRQILKLTLSCDHRVVDGAIGASFLQTLKSFLEEPVRMLV